MESAGVRGQQAPTSCCWVAETASHLCAGICSVVMCGWQAEEVAVSLCVLQRQ